MICVEEKNVRTETEQMVEAKISKCNRKKKVDLMNEIRQKIT